MALTSKQGDKMRGRKKKIMRASSAPVKENPTPSTSETSTDVKTVLKEAEVSVTPKSPIDTVCVDVPKSEEPVIVSRVAPSKWVPKFDTIRNMNMFLPEISERGGYLIRCREVQMTDGAWFRGLMMGRDGMLKIRTGIRYNEVFKHPHFIKELPEHALTEKRLSTQSINLDGELVLLMHNFGTKLTVQQGDIIGEITFC